MSRDSNLRREIISEGHLDFLEEMMERGIDLTIEQQQQLVKGGRVSLKDTDLKIATEDDKKVGPIDTSDWSSTKEEAEADSIVVVDDYDESVELTGRKFHKTVTIADDESYDKLQESLLFNYKSDKEITREDWMPSSLIEHSDDFVMWINSINSGFQNMVKYDKFRKYCQQAKNWLNDPTRPTDFETALEVREYKLNEIKRCKQNTLYFMDKYLMIKEGDMSTGNMKYLSKPAHKVICYMMDCGYSVMVGKGRQMAASTTFGGCALAKTIFNKNFFLKFIAQDDEKSQEIFDDKMKYPFNELPGFLKPTVSNDRDGLIRFRAKGNMKGTKKGLNSKIQVVPPSVGAINGGAPQCVFVDEAGYIGMLGKMMKEARPTMFMYDEVTGKLKMKRQIIIWGTGGTEAGEIKKKTKAYEIEFYDCLNHWKEKDYTYGIVPLFFDWTARPGMTKKFYLQELRAYTKEGPEKEASLIQFRQHFPSSPKDMFLSTGKLLVDASWIQSQMERIRNMPHQLRPKKGYFEPIFDTTKPYEEGSDVPYRIVGSKFIPVEDGVQYDHLVSAEIFVDPDTTWSDRFYMGTDPIMTDTGYSNMASVVWDAYYNTPAAIVNYRSDDHKYTFMQSLLLGLYYGQEKGNRIPELVESNIGTAYIDYLDGKGYYDSLVHRKELPELFTGGSATVGVDNKGTRATFIITKMKEVVMEYGHKIHFLEYFRQLETFTLTVSANGREVWGVSDFKNFKDDLLYATAFAYICRISFEFKSPRKYNPDSPRYTVRNKLTRLDDGTLTRTPVKIPMK